MEHCEKNEQIQITLFGRVLTPCKARIVSLLCYGLTRKEIAIALNVQVGTIGAHLDTLYKDLGFDNVNRVLFEAGLSGFEHNGMYRGHYLFSNYPNVPWLHGGKVPVPRSNQDPEPPTA